MKYIYKKFIIKNNAMKNIEIKRYQMNNNLIFSLLFLFFLQPIYAQTELIVNGAFGNGSSGWTLSGNFYADSRFSSCRSCPGYAYISNSDGTSGNNLVGSMFQNVSIPSNASSAVLTFWYYITTQETSSNAYDVLNVTIQNSSGSYLGSVKTLSNLDKSSGYNQVSFNVILFKGQTIRINFLGATDASLPTTFRIDDVSLLVSIAAGTISITSPGGGENWMKGTNYNVSWSSQNTNYPLKVELYKGNSMLRQLTTTAQISGSIVFNPPNDIPDGNDYRIAVAEVNGNAYKYSNYFTISSPVSQPTLLISPSSVAQNSGMFTFSGSNYTPNGTVNRFIKYSGQSTFTQISSITANSSGQINWTFSPTCTDPPVGTHTIYALDVSSGKQSNTVNEIVTANASCNAPSVTVTSPNGGENWQVGSTHDVTATTTGNFTGVQIDYSTNGDSTWNSITGYSTTNVSISYAWVVPNTLSLACKVRVTLSYSGGTVGDTSDGNFTISSNNNSIAQGKRIMALSNGANVRNYQNGQFSSPLFLQDAGVHGTITDGPIYGTAGGFTGNWWKINWDSEPPNQNNVQGWCAESVVSLAPLTGDVLKPNFTSNYYSSNDNIFWTAGYAPASTNPPSPQLGSALGNCTWYAYGRMLELGYDVSQMSALYKKASDWDSLAQVAHILVDSNPAVGCIAQTDNTAGGLGHVAVVESINSDGTITITESSWSTNAGSTWNFLWRHRTTSPLWFQHFIHVTKSSQLPAPTIVNINPNPVIGSADYQTITLSGSNFVNKPKVILTWTLPPLPPTGGYTVPDAQVTFVNSTKVQISIKTSTSADTWTAKVLNPDGQTSEPYSFNVQSPNTGNQNPTPLVLSAAMNNFAQTYQIPSIIVAAVANNESSWQHNDSNNNVKHHTNNDGSIDVGLMGINVTHPYFSDIDINKIYNDWNYNLEQGCRILKDKFAKSAVNTSSPYDTDKDTDPSILENWYYAIAWYNGSGDAAFNYVTKAINYIKNPVSPGNNYYSGISLYGNPQNLTGFPSTIEPTIPYPQGSLNLSTATPEQLISHGMYTLLILAQSGQKIHKWDWNTNSSSDITDLILGINNLTFTYNLPTSFNSISFPFIPQPQNFATLFSTISNNLIQKIFYLDNNGILQVNQFSEINAQSNTGYFVFLLNNANITVSGSTSNQNIVLHQGINFIGVNNNIVPSYNSNVYPLAFSLYNGSLVQTNMFTDGLKPGIGYLLLSLANNVLIQSNTSSKINDSIAVEKQKEKPIQSKLNTTKDVIGSLFITQSGSSNIISLKFGTKSNSNGVLNGYDSLDVIRDMPLPGNLIGYFDDSFGLKESYKPYADTIEWPLVVVSPSQSFDGKRNLSPVQINWIIPQNNNSVAFQLLDDRLNVLIPDMKVVNQLLFTPDTPSTKREYIIKMIFQTAANIISNNLPNEFRLYPNYPNPFNPSTTIKYYLPYSSNVKLVIYNSLGSIVKMLVNNYQASGFYEINFDAEYLASGIYYYSFLAISQDPKETYRDTKKLVLIK